MELAALSTYKWTHCTKNIHDGSPPETHCVEHLRPGTQGDVHVVNLHNNHVNHWHSFHHHSLLLVLLCELAFMDGLHHTVTQWLCTGMHKRDPQKHSIDMPFTTLLGIHLQLLHNAWCKQESVSYMIFLKDPRSVISLCLHKTPSKPSS